MLFIKLFDLTETFLRLEVFIALYVVVFFYHKIRCELRLSDRAACGRIIPGDL